MRHAASTSDRRPVALLAIYLVVSLAPLGLAFTQLMPGRGFAVNFSVALGFVALSVLGLQFALTARSSRLTKPFGINSVLLYHRQITGLAVLAAFGHPLILFLVDDHYRVLLDVLHAPGRAKLGWLSVAALAALIVTSVFRKALRLSYPLWHSLHTLLAVVIVLAALGHALAVDYYTSEPWVRAAWLLYGAAFFGLAAWVRIVKPLQRAMRPWRVAEVWPEPGGGMTLSLEPAVRGTTFEFEAGQFAWVQPVQNPLGMDYHPFSISSSQYNPRVEFTIKPAGSLADSLRAIRKSDRVYLDGPHGAFTLSRNPGAGYVFIATGVGVTPFLSMLATLADQGETRPCWLFLGNRHENQIIGIRQIARLAGRLNLTVVNVISRPSPHWSGETGHIDAEVMATYLPDHYEALQFFLCGRDEITRSLTRMLRLDLDVPTSRIHSEDFDLV